MATYNKFNAFIEALGRGEHDFDAHTFKVALTNTVPGSLTDATLADVAEIAAGNGYTAGGEATTISVSRVTSTLTITGTQVTFTASGGSIGPFRYYVLYNATADKVIAYWDYGSSITLIDGQTFTVKFSNTSPGTIFTAA